MKKIYFLLLLLPLITLYSCLKEEKDLFDSPASERMAQTLEKYSRILTEAPSGWIMEYFSQGGGYTYLCAFGTTGEVTVASDLNISQEYAPGDQVTSLYKLIADEGPVLTFDSYNNVFHYFADPDRNAPDGYEGDYEFIFMNGTSEKVELIGKKHGDRIVMTPLPAGTDWNNYLQTLVKVEDESAYGPFRLYIGEKSVGPAMFDDNRTFTFYADSEGNPLLVTQRVIYTTTGIKFYDPVTINGVTFENFVWNNTEKEFKCTDAGADVNIKVSIPDNYLTYQDFIGTYEFRYNGTLKRTVTVSEKVNNKALTMSGGFPFDIELTYSKLNGKISLRTQEVGSYNNNYVLIVQWDPIEGYLTTQPSAWYEAEWNKSRDNFVLTFKDNGGLQGFTVNGFLFWMVDSAGESLGIFQPAENSQYYLVSMKKQ